MRNSYIFGTWYKQKLTQVLARLWLHDLHILCWLYKYTRRNFKTYLLDLLKNSVFSLLKKGKEARRINTTWNKSDFQGENDVPWTLNSWKTCCMNGRFNSLRGYLFAELRISSSGFELGMIKLIGSWLPVTDSLYETHYAFVHLKPTNKFIQYKNINPRQWGNTSFTNFVKWARLHPTPTYFHCCFAVQFSVKIDDCVVFACFSPYIDKTCVYDVISESLP